MTSVPLRHNWQTDEVLDLFDQAFNDLLFKAQQTHRQYFDANEVQISSLMSIKTGACPEDCAYCPQSVHHDNELEIEKLASVEEVVSKARIAKQNGASRFCMGAAWKRPRDKDLEKVAEMIAAVRAEGMETCVTLGMLEAHQAENLKNAGLDYYNHNIDTSPEYYPSIITTREFSDRLDTLGHVREAGLKVCSGGIIGMGESRTDRARMLLSLANLPEHPHSVPINMLVQVEGTPLGNQPKLDSLEWVRTIAVARLMMPTSRIRLSAGRQDLNESEQALCFLAGANSLFYGEKLLTTGNPDCDSDQQLFRKLGLKTSSQACGGEGESRPAH